MPVSSRIRLGMFPEGRTSSFRTRSRGDAILLSRGRMTAISMIESRFGLNPVVSMSRTQNGVASPLGSSRSTGRSTRGRRLPRTVKSVDPSASTSCMPTVPMPATKPNREQLSDLFGESHRQHCANKTIASRPCVTQVECNRPHRTLTLAELRLMTAIGIRVNMTPSHPGDSSARRSLRRWVSTLPGPPQFSVSGGARSPRC